MDGHSQQTIDVINRFNEAFNRHDVDGIMALMTEDCIFENTAPKPDGNRYVGAKAVRGYWERFFKRTPDAYFAGEDIFASGDKCLVRWDFRYTGPDGKPDHVRGVDVFYMRDGKVAEKMSYVKTNA
jgi:ketosteroid isomerase-like protein